MSRMVLTSTRSTEKINTKLGIPARKAASFVSVLSSLSLYSPIFCHFFHFCRTF